MSKKESNKILNYQKLWKTKFVEVEKLFLDPENIRLDLEDMDQDEIINDLFVNEKAIEIVASIKEVGFFPDEPPVVVKEDGKFYVLEGNRRVVALKSMISPKIAPSKYVKNIRKIIGKARPITEIEVRLASSREDASVYLATKHTKNTRRPWTTLRRAYFYYAQKQKGFAVNKMIEKYKGVDIPKYIKYYEMHHIAVSLNGISDEIRENVANKRTFKITTLERFYSDDYVRDWMNININPDTGEVSVPKTESFDKVYSRVITDIVNKKATSREKLKTKESRKAYIV
ncbi:MAG: ParB/Srx family N-terminal domain-containing protein [Candidatus Kuenenbacteria bacterium]